MDNKRNKHLTKHDRDTIEGMLTKHNSCLKEISQVIQKATSTISKELKRNRSLTPATDFSGHPRNFCAKADNCYTKNLCLDFKDCDTYCKKCPMDCKTICKKFTPIECKSLSCFPWVCNGCKKRFKCKLPKYYYYARNAHEEYLEKLSNSRMGINLCPDEINTLSFIVASALEKGQPISHIVLSDLLNVPRSQRSLYNYIDKGYLSNVKNIDLRRKVSYRARKVDRRTLIRTVKDSRNITDFNDFVKNNSDVGCIVQMDTVEGRKTEPKCLLTLYFVDCHFMIARLLPNKQNTSILNAINELQNILGIENFKKLFPVILTDNGTEFVRPELFETDVETGEIRTNIFYCNPYSSFEIRRYREKPRIY